MYMWVRGIDFDSVFFILWLDYGMLGVFCISFFVMCLVIPVFPASLNCPFVIAPLLSLVYVKYSMHNVQDYSVLYSNLFAGCMRGFAFGKYFPLPQQFIKKESLGPYNEINRDTFHHSASTKLGNWAVMYLCA